MASKRSSTPKQGKQDEKDLVSGEQTRKAQEDAGGRAPVSDAQSGEEGIRAKGVDADAGDDVIDRITRSAPPVTDSGSRRE